MSGKTILNRFLSGEDVDDLAALREETRQAVSQSHRLLRAWDKSCDFAAVLANQAAGMAESMFAEYHPDDFVRGMLVGEGYAWMRAQSAFSHLSNAMRMSEHAEQGGDDGEG